MGFFSLDFSFGMKMEQNCDIFVGFSWKFSEILAASMSFYENWSNSEKQPQSTEGTQQIILGITKIA